MAEKVYRSELTPVSFLRRSAYMFPDEEAVIHGGLRNAEWPNQDRKVN